MRSSPLHAQAGFSLVELMIALAIGLMIVVGVGYVYLGSRQNFRTQDSLTTIQENARYALDTLSHDIRLAGYMGCGNLSSIPVNNISDDLNGATIDTDSALQVFPNGVLPDASNWTAPASITRKPNTDVLRIYEASGGGVPLAGNMSGTNANIQIGGNPYNFQANDVLLVSDCLKADVFTANNVAQAGGTVTIAHSNSVNTSNLLSKAYGLNPPPAYVYVFSQFDYFIGCPTADYAGGACKLPWALYRVLNGNAQPLVSNVENVAYTLGVDTSGTTPPAGAVGAYETPAQVNAANAWGQVLSVQLHLLLVGGAANDTNAGVNASPQHYSFNGTTYTATDRRLYQEVVATVAIRNRL